MIPRIECIMTLLKVVGCTGRLLLMIMFSVRFQNLNATISVESSSALGDLVFTLTTNDEHFHHSGIILKTDSKYFETNPTDQSKAVHLISK